MEQGCAVYAPNPLIYFMVIKKIAESASIYKIFISNLFGKEFTSPINFDKINVV